MTTLASGSSVTFGLAVDQTFEMSFADGTTGTITVTGPLGAPYRTTFGPAKKNNWKPFPLGATGRVVVACTAGSVSYTLGSSMFVTAVTDTVTGARSLVSAGDKLIAEQKYLTPKNNLGSRIFSAKVLTDSAQLGWTHHIGVVAETPFSAVRVVMFNDIAATVGITSGVVAATANLTSKHVPSGGNGAFVPITWGGATSVSLAARTSSQRPSVTYSDWIPLASLPRDDGGTFPIIFARVYIAATTGAYCINYTDTSNESNADGRVFYSRRQNGDFVSNLGGFADGNQRNSMPIHGIEYLAQGKCTTVWAHGDSITQGGGSVAPSNHGWGYEACAIASTEDSPVVFANYGWNGQTTSQYYNRLVDLIAYGYKPSILVYSPFSPNDGTPTQAIIDAQLARTVLVMDLARRSNIKVILTTPAPNTSLSWTAPQDAFRLSLKAKILAMADRGIPIVDFDAVLSDGATPARYIAAMTDDGLHPSQAGYSAMAQVMAPAIAAMVE